MKQKMLVMAWISIFGKKNISMTFLRLTDQQVWDANEKYKWERAVTYIWELITKVSVNSAPTLQQNHSLNLHLVLVELPISAQIHYYRIQWQCLKFEERVVCSHMYVISAFSISLPWSNACFNVLSAGMTAIWSWQIFVFDILH